jgi:hypothetical protein
MAEDRLSNDVYFAFEHFPVLTQQLKKAGYDLYDGDGTWSLCDNPPGYWCVEVKDDGEGHRLLVISINGYDDSGWGLSYGTTLCGESRGTAYWSGKTKQMLDMDEDWADLDAAVLKVRSLLQQEGPNGCK